MSRENSYQRALEEAIEHRDPPAQLTVSELARSVEAIFSEVKARTEVGCPSTELPFRLELLSAQWTATLALPSALMVGDVDLRKRLPGEASETKGPGARLAHSRSRLPLVARAALALALLVVLFSSSAPSALAGILFCSYIALELVERGKASLTGHGESVVADTVLETTRFLSSVRKSAESLDSAANLYSQLQAQCRAVGRAATGRGASKAEELRVFQQLLGAARRGHPQLPELVEAQSLSSLTRAGLNPVSYQAGVNEDMFEMQNATDGREQGAVELYPALVSTTDSQVQSKGRVVQ